MFYYGELGVPHYTEKMASPRSVKLLLFQLSDFAGFRKSPKTSLKAREAGRARIFPSHVHLKHFIPCLPRRALSTAAALRDSALSSNTRGFVLKRRRGRAGFPDNEAAAVPQPRHPLSACVCFRYCSGGNYRRWYGGLLHSAAYVPAGARLLPVPPTQRQ